MVLSDSVLLFLSYFPITSPHIPPHLTYLSFPPSSSSTSFLVSSASSDSICQHLPHLSLLLNYLAALFKFKLLFCLFFLTPLLSFPLPLPPLTSRSCLLAALLLLSYVLLLLIFLPVSSPTLPLLPPFLPFRWCSRALIGPPCPPCYIISSCWRSVIKHRIMPHRAERPSDIQHAAVITSCNYICLSDKGTTGTLKLCCNLLW